MPIISSTGNLNQTNKLNYSYKLFFFQLQKPEDVKVELAPGTYAITAGRWGAKRDHTHVVHVSPGQTIDLTFGV